MKNSGILGFLIFAIYVFIAVIGFLTRMISEWWIWWLLIVITDIIFIIGAIKFFICFGDNAKRNRFYFFFFWFSMLMLVSITVGLSIAHSWRIISNLVIMLILGIILFVNRTKQEH